MKNVNKFCKEKPFKRGFKKVVDKLNFNLLYDEKSAHYIYNLYSNSHITKLEYFTLMYMLLYINHIFQPEIEGVFKKRIINAFSDRKLNPKEVLNENDRELSFFKYFSECMVTFYEIESIHDFKHRLYKLHALMGREYHNKDKEIHSVKGLFELLSRIK